jgi:uncharacterized membrane protein YidH (DUF202 family)
MKRFIYTLTSASLLALPFIINAAGIATSDGGDSAFGKLLRNILEFTNKTLIPFIIGIGFLVFVYGMFKYFIAGGADEEKREGGKQLMIYATLGFVLIIVFWGIVNLLTSSTGFEGKSLENADNFIEIPS